MNNRLLVLLLVAFSGFISLSYEVLWARVFSYSTGARAYAFPMLLGLFLTGIAVGARISKRYSKRFKTLEREQMRTIALFIAASAVGGWLVIPLMAAMLSVKAPIPQFTALYLVGGAAVLLGAQFPLITHYGVAADERSGANLSYLYLANVLGSVLGSLSTGFLFMDWMSSASLSTMLACLGLGSSALLFLYGRPKRNQAIGFVLFSLVLAAALIGGKDIVYDRVWEKLYYAQKYEGQRFKRIIENKSGIITVDDKDKVYGGGIYDGTFSVDIVDDVNGILRPYAMSAFHPAPKKVLMIGLATGAWARAAVNHPQLEKLTIIEINPGYLELLQDYPEYAALLDHPKIELIIDDGRRWLHTTDRKFDFVLSNSTFNFRAMASNLLSVDFIRLLKEHLEPGGVVTINTTGSMRVAASVREVLPHGYLFLRSTYASPDPIDFDRKRLLRVLRDYRIDGEPLLDLSNPRHRERLREIDLLLQVAPQNPNIKPLSEVPQLPVITDDNMGTEFEVDLLGL